jgi:6-phosphogluconolactonase (cycloisomerase 2 family)
MSTVAGRLRLAIAIAFAGLLFGAPAALAAPMFSPVVGSPFNISANVAPEAIAYSPSGKLVAVADGNYSYISIFSVTSSTGALTEDGPPTATSDGAYDVAFSPSGDLLASLNGDGSVSVYSVDQATGTLTFDATTSVSGACDFQEDSVEFSPSGDLLAVPVNCNNSSSGIQIFAVNQSNGTVTSDSTTATTSICPVTAEFSPSGDLLASAASCADANDGVQMFAVHASNGTLTSDGTTLMGMETCPASTVFNPSGSLLAVANQCTNDVQVFGVASGGTLTPEGTASTGGCPLNASFNATGSLLAAADECEDTVSVFSVTQAGDALTAVSGSPYSTGTNSNPIATSFSPNGSTLAIADELFGAVTVLSLAPPSAAIASPAPGGVYAVGQSVPTTFTCTDGADGPGISACQDSNGAAGPHGAFSTTALGAHAYVVTATSQDGLASQASISYTVVAAPTARITSPASGGVYAIGKSVTTSFSCAEASGGPGIASCTDSGSSRGPTGTLDTSTLGPHTYTVTAFSEDGGETTAALTYTVVGPPTITIAKPLAGGTYTRDSKVKASYSCQDAAPAPAIASCTGTVANGAAISTSKTGTHKLTVTATSSDGLTTTKTVSYKVVLPNNKFTITHVTVRGNGSVVVKVKLPGPGKLHAVLTAPKRLKVATGSARAKHSGDLTMTFAPTKSGLRLIRKGGSGALGVTYTPTGGVARTLTFPGVALGE